MQALQLIERLFEAEDPKQALRLLQRQANRIPPISQVEFDLFCEEEDLRPDYDDEEAQQWVRNQLRRGNQWAWFSAHVVASWTATSGVDYTGEAYLGGCSYRNREDFMQDGYYEDLKERAYDDRVEELTKAGFRP